MKTVFIIAGFNLDITAVSPDYQQLLDGLSAKGYRVVPVPINWRHKTHTSYIKEFVPFYMQHRGDYNIIIGNSFGAAAAFIAAPGLQSDELYLCSLSPFFQEDRGRQPDQFALQHFGKRRSEDLWARSARIIAERIRSKTFVLYGELEHQTSPILVRRCQETAAQIAGARLVELPGAPHSMRDPRYIDALLGLF